MRAFTLAELLIVIGIIGILGGVIVFSSTRGQETYKLLNTSEEVEAVLRRAQGLSLAVTDFEGAPPGGGWGVRLYGSQNCYILFADVDPDGLYNGATEGGNPCNTSLNDPASERFERIFFPPSVEISQLLLNGDPVSELDIVYRPPLLATFFNGTIATPGSTAQVVVRSQTLTTTKTITLNSVGNVEVN